MSEETILYQANPSMFRNHPVAFVFTVLFSLVGVGLFVLIPWWLQVKAIELTITDKRTSLRKGIFSKETTDVFHDDVRNVQLKQTFLNRLLDVGYLGVSSAGQGGVEIEVGGVPDPDGVQALIYKYKNIADEADDN